MLACALGSHVLPLEAHPEKKERKKIPNQDYASTSDQNDQSLWYPVV